MRHVNVLYILFIIYILICFVVFHIFNLTLPHFIFNIPRFNTVVDVNVVNVAWYFIWNGVHVWVWNFLSVYYSLLIVTCYLQLKNFIFIVSKSLMRVVRMVFSLVSACLPTRLFVTNFDCSKRPVSLFFKKELILMLVG